MEEEVEKLDGWLIQQGTEADIRKLIVRAITKWKRGETVTTARANMQDLLGAQNEIGWHNFLFGLVAKEWAILQQKEYERQGSRRTGKRWVTALIRKLWDISWDMWMLRNRALHTGDKVEEFNDPETLENAVRSAFDMGEPRPCPRHLRPWFRYNAVAEILSKTAYEQRRWISTVRTIRANMAETYRQTDVQQMRRNMRTWL